MTDIAIPPAALEAGCSAYTAVIYRGNGTQAEFREAIRAAFVAMVAAWPGMRVDDTFRWLSDVAIILPMEDKNAES